MNITEYIKYLEDIKKEHGDLPIYTYSHNGSINILNDYQLPKVENLAEKLGREQKQSIWQSWYEGKRKKGIKICRI